MKIPKKYFIKRKPKYRNQQSIENEIKNDNNEKEK